MSVQQKGEGKEQELWADSFPHDKQPTTPPVRTPIQRAELGEYVQA